VRTCQGTRQADGRVVADGVHVWVFVALRGLHICLLLARNTPQSRPPGECSTHGTACRNRETTSCICVCVCIAIPVQPCRWIGQRGGIQTQNATLACPVAQSVATTRVVERSTQRRRGGVGDKKNDVCVCVPPCRVFTRPSRSRTTPYFSRNRRWFRPQRRLKT
jgi:hypothetical protein